MPNETIKVFIVDDHAVVRKGIRALLTTEPDMEVVGEATNGREAVEFCEKAEPDVILMDLVMPKMDGVEATRKIRAVRPDTQILVVTSFGSDRKLFPAVKAGAIGYILKDASPDELIRAVRNAAAGRTSLHPAIARRLLAELSRDAPRASKGEPLTARETELLRCLARGLTNDQMADELHISEATVRTHVSHILGKLKLANRTQAALYALREGIASLHEIPY